MLSDQIPTHAPWMDRAGCQGLETVDIPVDVCARCNVRPQCLNHALRNDVRDGRWGGYSTEERDELLDLHAGDVYAAVTATAHVELQPNRVAAMARHPSSSAATRAALRAQLELDFEHSSGS